MDHFVACPETHVAVIHWVPLVAESQAETAEVVTSLVCTQADKTMIQNWGPENWSKIVVNTEQWPKSWILWASWLLNFVPYPYGGPTGLCQRLQVSQAAVPTDSHHLFLGRLWFRYEVNRTYMISNIIVRKTSKYIEILCFQAQLSI